MSVTDWLVLVLSMVGIVAYGLYKGRGNQSIGEYFSSGSSIKWFTIGLSIMATQASAITFLSAPGQAFTKGMGFVQFYFGLPLAMIVISALIIPIYKRLNVLTAYAYLADRFDNKTRLMGAALFMIQRGLAAGFTVYAPALVLSSILGWNIYHTNLIIGILVIIYTVFGGTKAVAHTHKLQMIVILLGMALAAVLALRALPHSIGLLDALDLAGAMGRLETVDWEFDPNSKYNVWSGLLGGFFLALSYFGTDQSQVQRYLGPQPIIQSRIGLLFNGFVKIPMQFFILFIGILVFVFYQFSAPPIYFNKAALGQAEASPQGAALGVLKSSYLETHELKQSALGNYLNFKEIGDELAAIEMLAAAKGYQVEADKIKEEAVAIIRAQSPGAESNDVNYIFLQFVLSRFPVGVIGLLLACILFASMSSTSGELNALASTTLIDVYQANLRPGQSEKHYLRMSKWFTAFWGLYAILFAFFAGGLGSLIEAVNILGSVFYGTILGIFLVGFFIRYIRGTAVFIAALLAQVVIGLAYWLDWMAYLWLPLMGAALVIVFGLAAQYLVSRLKPREKVA
ncbi:MAG: sodium:solute symporter [Bacteroidetes bacterium]|jgi:SSS family transporter|nr:sodium:solute symporter [Bacteroidota bacterium]